MKEQCPFCNAPVSARARFCGTCGRPLPQAHFPLTIPAATAESPDPPVEVALPSARQIDIKGDTLDLSGLINVVESGVRWWQAGLNSADDVTRERAAESIEELSKILHSLSQQLAQGRSTVRITTRLPVLRQFVAGCPTCGQGNRAGAKFCIRCRTPLAGPAHPPADKGKPMPLRISIAARTDQGRVRTINQDAVYTGSFTLRDGTPAYLCLVADGMGGAQAGEHASRIASEVTRAQVTGSAEKKRPADDAGWESLLRQAAFAANKRVYDDSRANVAHHGMGTTLTIALIVGDRLHIASVGDSRAYLLNTSGVTEDGAETAQLTSDHSLVARLVDIGQLTPEQARVHPQRNMLYRSIGTDPAVEVDTRSEPLEPGDIVLLCSDGLVNYVEDAELARSILKQPDLERTAEQLVALANQRGGRDNISVVLMRVEGQK